MDGCEENQPMLEKTPAIDSWKRILYSFEPATNVARLTQHRHKFDVFKVREKGYFLVIVM